MKKKIGIILAVVLCMSLILTFAACGKDEVKVSEEQVAQKATVIDSYLDQWVAQHAQDTITNQSAQLRRDLEARSEFSAKADGNSYVKPTYTVSFSNITNTYTVTASWNGTSRTFTKKAQASEYSSWSGVNLEEENYEPYVSQWYDQEDSTTEALDIIFKALANEVNKVTGNSVTGKFSTDSDLILEVAGKRYGLRVKGNIDGTTAANNQIGLILLDDNKNELGGLYYVGAENAADSKLYLQYSTTGDDGKLVRENGKIVYGYKYINYADIFGYVASVLPEFKETANSGVWTDKGGYSTVDSIASFFNNVVGINQGGLVASIIAEFADTYYVEGENNEEHYVIDIDLESVMAQATELVGKFGDISESVAFLNVIQLDLATMHGLRGHLTITATVEKSEETFTNYFDVEENYRYLKGFEVTVNIPKDCTFFFSNKGDAFSIGIPALSFSIGVENFKFYEADTITVLPELPDNIGYFSPANLDVSGDLYINHAEDGNATLDDTFHFQLVTDINPLEIIENKMSSTARVAFTILRASGDKIYGDDTKAQFKNFLTISYEQADKLFCVSGTAFGLDDNGETVYTFKMSSLGEALAEINKWIGLDYQGFTWKDGEGFVIVYGEDGTTIAQPAMKALLESTIGKNLMKYFAEKTAEKKEGKTNGAEFSPSSIGDYFSEFKALYESLVADGTIDFDMDDASLSVHVTPTVINKVTAMINKTFKVTLPTDIKDPEDVRLEVNTAPNYKDQVFISVKYDGATYTLTFDGSKDDLFAITFKMVTKTNREYIVEFKAEDNLETVSGTKWSASVTVDIKNAKGVVEDHTEVRLSNFHAEWGNDNKEEVEALIPSKDVKAAASPIFGENGTGPATQLIKGVVYVLDQEAIEGLAEWLGKFIIRQIWA